MRRVTPRIRILIVLLTGLALLIAGSITVPLLMVMSTTAAGTDTSGDDTTNCGPSAEVAGQTITLDSDQLANAKIIIQTGQSLNVPSRGLVVGIATALQESTLNNLNNGTGTSKGLFQQIDAWGPASARTDPPTASTMFFTGGQGGQPGLLDIAGWAAMTINDAAQAVQASGYPNAYTKWEALAASLVHSVTGNDPLSCSNALAADLPTGAIGTMISTALAQQGKPYEWSAVGPDSFDCSGLVIYSWGQAGYRVQVRTAAEMYDNSTPVAPGSEKPGDLLFGEFDRAGQAHHVMIVVQPGTAVEAPRTGLDVRVVSYTADGTRWRLAQLKPSILTAIKQSGAGA